MLAAPLNENLSDLIDKHGLQEYKERIFAMARDTFVVQTQKSLSDFGLNSRGGGLPSLPPDTNWPRNKEGEPLSFICQFNLTEISHHFKIELLPKTGMLSFFVDTEDCVWGWESDNLLSWRVYYSEDEKLCEPIPFPDDMPDYLRTEPKDITLLHSFCLPRRCDLDCLGAAVVQHDRYINMVLDIMAFESRLLGYPSLQQDEDIRVGLDRLLDANTNTTSEMRSDRALEWIMLFQIDTVSDIGFECLGSILYFLIRRESLEAGDFSEVYLLTQTT